MKSIPYVSVEELRKIQAEIGARIQFFEAQAELLQYQQAVGFLTGKTCQYCQKQITEPTQAEAERVAAVPDNQAAWAHEHCQEIQTLRAELGKADPERRLQVVPEPGKAEENAGA